MGLWGEYGLSLEKAGQIFQHILLDLRLGCSLQRIRAVLVVCTNLSIPSLFCLPMCLLLLAISKCKLLQMDCSLHRVCSVLLLICPKSWLVIDQSPAKISRSSCQVFVWSCSAHIGNCLCFPFKTSHGKEQLHKTCCFVLFSAINIDITLTQTSNV